MRNEQPAVLGYNKHAARNIYYCCLIFTVSLARLVFLHGDCSR